MRKDGIWNWTLPAWVVQRSNGQHVNVCPQAGACAKLCYARTGTFMFPAVKAAHQRNLDLVLDDLPAWRTLMASELGHRRFRPSGVPRMPWLGRGHLHPVVANLLDAGAAAVRIHDSGDFLSEEYLRAWLWVAGETPDVLFYAYTKEVALFKGLLTHDRPAPPNFLWVYSLGGRQDHLIDRDRDRHAEVFPDETAIRAAGYVNQDAHDLLCVLSPGHRIGIPANNIPAVRKRMAGQSFGEVEAGIRRRR